jgi:hypothetical protein
VDRPWRWRASLNFEHGVPWPDQRDASSALRRRRGTGSRARSGSHSRPAYIRPLASGCLGARRRSDLHRKDVFVHHRHETAPAQPDRRDGRRKRMWQVPTSSRATPIRQSPARAGRADSFGVGDMWSAATGVTRIEDGRRIHHRPAHARPTWTGSGTASRSATRTLRSGMRPTSSTTCTSTRSATSGLRSCCQTTGRARLSGREVRRPWTRHRLTYAGSSRESPGRCVPT